MLKPWVQNIKASDISSVLLILSTCFLIATLPFGYTGANRIAIYVLLGTFIADYVASGVYKEWRFGIGKLYFLAMILFFALQFIFLPFEQNTEYFSKICEDRLSFLAIGVIGFMGVNKRLKLEYLAWTCVITAVLCSLFLLSFSLDERPWWYDIRTYLADHRVIYVCSHMLFNLYINSAIIACFFLIHRYKKWWVRGLIVVAMVILLTVISLTEGRIGFISGIIVTLFLISVDLWRWKKWTIFIIAAPLLIAGIAIYFQDKLTLEKIGNDPRGIIWGETLNNIKESPWGVGASTAADKMNQSLARMWDEGTFTDVCVHKAVEEKSIYGAHAHNQYLQSTLEYGPIGALVLLIILIAPIFICCKEMRIYTIAFCFLFGNQLCTDILVSGIMPIGFLLVLCLLVTYNVTPDNSKL